jgi:hypothetical protein
LLAGGVLVLNADVPSCYFLSVCAGSSVDQHTNNVSLFNLVEQINVPAGAPPPPQGVVPLELHAYWQLDSDVTTEDFEVRFVLVASTGLETSSTTYRHRAVHGRFRTRTVGLPYPPVLGHYTLRVDWRYREEQPWHREGVSWPVMLQELDRKPRVTH